jgi:hypothetical protein
MSEVTTLPAPVIAWPPPPANKWEREYQAFRRLLPQLLLTQRGRYVAIHNEEVIDHDTEEIPLILRVLKRVGNVPIHVALVTEDIPPIRIPRYREVRRVTG